MRRFLLLLAAGAVATSVASAAMANEKCYKLGTWDDVLILEFPDKANGHQQIYGVWTVPGSYVIPVTGTAEHDVDPKIRRISLVGTNTDSGIFNGNLICALDGVPNAAVQVQCSGGPAANYQASNTPLTKISCRGLPQSSGSATAAGAGRRQ